MFILLLLGTNFFLNLFIIATVLMEYNIEYVFFFFFLKKKININIKKLKKKKK